MVSDEEVSEDSSEPIGEIRGLYKTVLDDLFGQGRVVSG